MNTATHHNMKKVYAPNMRCIHKGREWEACDLGNKELNLGHPPGTNDMWRPIRSL